MATMAFDEPGEKGAAKTPISLHPAFPAIVALWFAALLGIGSLVLPAVLLERAVAATGLASLVPAAAPPLGFTARAMLAVAAALAGTGIGIAIARRVAKSHARPPESRTAKLSAGSRRPISIKDEVGGQGVINGEGLPINRRRALAISEDDRPSDFLYQAPLPGERAEAATPLADEAPGETEPLELSDLADEAPADPAPDAIPPADHEDSPMTDFREFPPVSSAQPFDAPEAELSRRSTFGQRGAEPLPFSAPSLARHEPEPEPEPRPALEAEEALAAEPEAYLAAVPESAEEPDPELRADWETAPLDGLGLVQLVQRLGSTIERRRELMAQAAAALPVAAPFVAGPADFEAAPAEEAAQAMAAYFGSVPTSASSDEILSEAEFSNPAETPSPTDWTEAATARPGFLSPFAAPDEEEDAEDPLPDFSLPLRRKGAATPAFTPLHDDEHGEEADPYASFAADESDEDHEDDGYSSLLGMSNPFSTPKGEFVRIEEPEPAAGSFEPAVVFPGQGEPTARLFDPPGQKAGSGGSAPRVPADTDDALRAALATLQRMSGAA